MRQHDQYYRDTTLRHPAVDSTFNYHDRDLFAEMIKPLRQRGMKVYPRILEAGGRGIVNFSPDTIYQATVKAFDANADGIVVSREYEEMKLANLRAVGRAYRDVMKTRGSGTAYYAEARRAGPRRSEH